MGLFCPHAFYNVLVHVWYHECLGWMNDIEWTTETNLPHFKFWSTQPQLPQISSICFRCKSMQNKTFSDRGLHKSVLYGHPTIKVNLLASRSFGKTMPTCSYSLFTNSGSTLWLRSFIFQCTMKWCLIGRYYLQLINFNLPRPFYAVHGGIKNIYVFKLHTRPCISPRLLRISDTWQMWKAVLSADCM